MRTRKRARARTRKKQKNNNTSNNNTPGLPKRNVIIIIIIIIIIMSSKDVVDAAAAAAAAAEKETDKERVPAPAEFPTISSDSSGDDDDNKRKRKPERKRKRRRNRRHSGRSPPTGSHSDSEVVVGRPAKRRRGSGDDDDDCIYYKFYWLAESRKDDAFAGCDITAGHMVLDGDGNNSTAQLRRLAHRWLVHAAGSSWYPKSAGEDTIRLFAIDINLELVELLDDDEMTGKQLTRCGVMRIVVCPDGLPAPVLCEWVQAARFKEARDVNQFVRDVLRDVIGASARNRIRFKHVLGNEGAVVEILQSKRNVPLSLLQSCAADPAKMHLPETD